MGKEERLKNDRIVSNNLIKTKHSKIMKETSTNKPAEKE